MVSEEGRGGGASRWDDEVVGVGGGVEGAEIRFRRD